MTGADTETGAIAKERAHFLHLFDDYRRIGGLYVRKVRAEDISWVDTRRSELIARLRDYWGRRFTPWLADCRRVPGGRFYGTGDSPDRVETFDVNDGCSSCWQDIAKGPYRVLCGDPTDWPVMITDPALTEEERQTAVRALDGTEGAFVHRQELAERKRRMDRRRSRLWRLIGLCNEIILRAAVQQLGYDGYQEFAWAEVNGRRYLLYRNGDWKMAVGPGDDDIPTIHLDKPREGV